MKAEPLDEDLVTDLALTTKFATDEHATNTTNLEHLLDAGEITWDLLWAIFPPNSLVCRYHQLIEEDQILQVRTIRQMKRMNGSQYWLLRCRIVADDGVKFGLAYEPFLMIISEFDGARKITDLRIFPLKHHAQAAKLRVDAMRRGQRFAELAKTRVMETRGPAMFEKRDPLGDPEPYKFTSCGRMIIDPAGFKAFNPNIDFMPEVIRELSRDKLTDEEYIICTPVAFGFCFGNKKWGTWFLKPWVASHSTVEVWLTRSLNRRIRHVSSSRCQVERSSFQRPRLGKVGKISCSFHTPRTMTDSTTSSLAKVKAS